VSVSHSLATVPVRVAFADFPLLGGDRRLTVAHRDV